MDQTSPSHRICAAIKNSCEMNRSIVLRVQFYMTYFSEKERIYLKQTASVAALSGYCGRKNRVDRKMNCETFSNLYNKLSPFLQDQMEGLTNYG